MYPITRILRFDGAAHQTDARVRAAWFPGADEFEELNAVEQARFAADLDRMADQTGVIEAEEVEQGQEDRLEPIRGATLPTTYLPETWRDIEGVAGRYQVSNAGRVRRLDKVVRVKDTGDLKVVARILKRQTDPKGYLTVQLPVPEADGSVERRTQMVARLMLLAFKPDDKPPSGVARYLDKNPANVDLTNLYWGTMTEAAQDAAVTKKRNAERDRKRDEASARPVSERPPRPLSETTRAPQGNTRQGNSRQDNARPEPPLGFPHRPRT